MGRLKTLKRENSSLQSDTPQASENLSDQSDGSTSQPVLAGKKRRRPFNGRSPQQVANGKDKSAKLLVKSDDELDDDDLIEKLEAQQKKQKEAPVDLEKMTRR